MFSVVVLLLGTVVAMGCVALGWWKSLVAADPLIGGAVPVYHSLVAALFLAPALAASWPDVGYMLYLQLTARLHSGAEAAILLLAALYILGIYISGYCVAYVLFYKRYGK